LRTKQLKIKNQLKNNYKMRNNGLNAGLNAKESWWSRFTGAVRRVLKAGSTGGLCGMICAALDELLDMRVIGGVGVELTPSEDEKITTYLNTQFLPFYNTLAKLVDGVFVYIQPPNSSGRIMPQNTELINTINVVRRRYAVLRAYSTSVYFLSNQEIGWTRNMFLARRDMFIYLGDKLDYAIVEYLKSHNLGSIPTKIVKFRASDTLSIGAMGFDWNGKDVFSEYTELEGGTIDIAKDFANSNLYPDYVLTEEDILNAENLSDTTTGNNTTGNNTTGNTTTGNVTTGNTTTTTGNTPNNVKKTPLAFRVLFWLGVAFTAKKLLSESK